MEHCNRTKGRDSILVASLITVKQVSICILPLTNMRALLTSLSYISLFVSSRAKAAERKMKLTPCALTLKTHLNLK